MGGFEWWLKQANGQCRGTTGGGRQPANMAASKKESLCAPLLRAQQNQQQD
jgi:hypothetical protein